MALLDDPCRAERVGVAAQARVRERFLGPRRLGQYVDLLERVLPRGATCRSSAQYSAAAAGVVTPDAERSLAGDSLGMEVESTERLAAPASIRRQR